MNFLKGIVEEMKLTTWPSMSQSWRDFFQVIEYTIFFLIFIMIFDWLSKNGITSAVEHLLPLLKK